MFIADYPYIIDENDSITSINERIAELSRNLGLLGVSVECCAPLGKMLEIDLIRQINVLKILKHEWFVTLEQETLK
jgi:hypothetical protein